MCACMCARTVVSLPMEVSQFLYTVEWTGTGPQINLVWNLKLPVSLSPCLSIDDSWYGDEDKIMAHMLLMFHMVYNPHWCLEVDGFWLNDRNKRKTVP